MYYPFLRARQFELIALRELAMENVTQDFVVPILEPVKETHNNLTLANDVFIEHNQIAYLIVNSKLGMLDGDETQFLDYLASLKESAYLPAFHYRSNADYIIHSIERYRLADCMIICQNDLSSDDPDFFRLVRRAEVAAVNVSDPNRNRTLHRILRSAGKQNVRLDDLFKPQSRNSDYLSIDAHRFSEEHLYYQEEGFSGISDYTVLPSEYIEGGSTPRAVAIHLTYLDAQKCVWIRHFTSETNDSTANVQGKFKEAADKAVNFCKQKSLTNSAIVELESYFYNGHYPGLGTVKKISIKNHLLVICQYLKNK